MATHNTTYTDIPPTEEKFRRRSVRLWNNRDRQPRHREWKAPTRRTTAQEHLAGLERRLLVARELAAPCLAETGIRCSGRTRLGALGRRPLGEKGLHGCSTGRLSGGPSGHVRTTGQPLRGKTARKSLVAPAIKGFLSTPLEAPTDVKENFVGFSPVT